jgi:hypothetical protein
MGHLPFLWEDSRVAPLPPTAVAVPAVESVEGPFAGIIPDKRDLTMLVDACTSTDDLDAYALPTPPPRVPSVKIITPRPAVAVARGSQTELQAPQAAAAAAPEHRPVGESQRPAAVSIVRKGIRKEAPAKKVQGAACCLIALAEGG